MKKHAALYARVSSDRQKDQKTIASQTALLREYADSHEYVVPKEWIFEDEGYSGGMLARPGLERLRDLVTEGLIETVLVYAPDRLSRNYAYQVLLIEEFSRGGAETVFLKSAGGDSPEDRLLVQFQGMIAEYERAQIAERSRRGKRHRAKAGCVNVLSGAPYGYRYVRKTETAEAYYAVIEPEAEVVREVFERYAHQLWSIGAIARQLNGRGVATRFGRGPWERSTLWGMLRNPAYQGLACFGKTEAAPRQRITKPLRQKGGFSTRSNAHRDRDPQDWIAVPVPALVSAETFALAQERLVENQRFSARRTKAPTLLQGLLVCGHCGYGLYRTSTKTTRRQVQYYRCLGSDRYRHLRGPACSCRPIRQDYLDGLVWQEVVRLLNTPELVRAEVDRRIAESLSSDPVQQRKGHLERESKRLGAQLDKLLDAYQEDLIGLAELRRRAPELRRRQTAVEKELEGVALQALEHRRLVQLNASMEAFLAALQRSAKTLEVAERQKIVRLVIKQIIVNADTLTIEHSIPVSRGQESPPSTSYLLCTRSNHPALRGATFGGKELTLAVAACLEHRSQQRQHPTIRHPL
jgi:site-specific DNA recombinase